MATIKSYSDLEQSKKLAEILPIESADMWWSRCTITDFGNGILKVSYAVEPCNISQFKNTKDDIPCWSLAALLGVLPKEYTNSKNQVCTLHIDIEDSEKPYLIWYANPEHEGSIVEIKTEQYSNLVDACYEMILKLHELNLL